MTSVARTLYELKVFDMAMRFVVQSYPDLREVLSPGELKPGTQGIQRVNLLFPRMSNPGAMLLLNLEVLYRV